LIDPVVAKFSAQHYPLVGRSERPVITSQSKGSTRNWGLVALKETLAADIESHNCQLLQFLEISRNSRALTRAGLKTSYPSSAAEIADAACRGSVEVRRARISASSSNERRRAWCSNTWAVMLILSGWVRSRILSKRRSEVSGEPTTENNSVWLAEAFSTGDQNESMSSMGGGTWPGAPRRRFVKDC